MSFFKPEDFATAWCALENSHKEMDVVLALTCSEIANRLVEPLLEENERLKAELSLSSRDSLVARQALNKLKTEIEQAPVVLLTWELEQWFSRSERRDATHKARLVRIEEIKKCQE